MSPIFDSFSYFLEQTPRLFIAFPHSIPRDQLQCVLNCVSTHTGTVLPVLNTLV